MLSSNESYWFILLIQFISFILLPSILADKVRRKRIIRSLKFLPIAVIVGFIWDNIMAYFDVWVWGKGVGPFILFIPVQDIVFIIEIYLIPAVLTAYVVK